MLRRPSARVGALHTAIRSLFVQCRDTPNDDCMMFFATGYEFVPLPAGSTGPVMTITVTKENKHISPLAKRIFALEGIDEVTIGQRFVTVTRQTEPDPVDEDEGDVADSISVTNTAAIKEGKAYVDRVPSSKVTPSPASGGVHVKTFVMPDMPAWEPPHWFDLQFNVCAAITDHAHCKEPTIELDAPHPHVDTLPKEGDSEIVLAIKELIATLIRPEIQKDGGDIRFVAFDDASGAMNVELLGACKTCKSSSTTLADLIERTTRHWIPEVTSIVEVNQRKKRMADVAASVAGGAQLTQQVA
jgi:Fe-S cluster biogenesis protein NfuA